MSRENDQRRRRPVSYANVTATLALFLALAGGTAWATSHYLISKTNQIKPSVRAALKGDVGATGFTGPTGATGATGTTTATPPLVDGQTLSKIFFKEPPSTPASGTTVLYSGDGLTLSGACSAAGYPVLTATTSDPNAELNDSGNDDSAFFADEEDGLTGTDTILSAADPNRGSLILAYSNNSGQVVKATIGFDDEPSFDSFFGCGIWGTVSASS